MLIGGVAAAVVAAAAAVVVVVVLKNGRPGCPGRRRVWARIFEPFVNWGLGRKEFRDFVFRTNAVARRTVFGLFVDFRTFLADWNLRLEIVRNLKKNQKGAFTCAVLKCDSALTLVTDIIELVSWNKSSSLL